MQCKRCGNNIPEFLWTGNDHPILLDHPITVNRTDFPDVADEAKITAHIYINTAKMCSDVNPAPPAQHVMEFTITMQEDTPVDEAQKIREKTLTVLNHFLSWMGQPDCTIGSSLEIN